MMAHENAGIVNIKAYLLELGLDGQREHFKFVVLMFGKYRELFSA